MYINWALTVATKKLITAAKTVNGTSAFYGFRRISDAPLCTRSRWNVDVCEIHFASRGQHIKRFRVLGHVRVFMVGKVISSLSETYLVKNLSERSSRIAALFVCFAILILLFLSFFAT